MAISSSAQSLAPTEFSVCQSFEVPNGAISVAVEHCQLCGGTKRSFYCKVCVNNGEFTSSNSKESAAESESDRYADKLERWHILKRERLKFLERIENACRTGLRIDEKKTKIALMRQRISQLKAFTAEAQISRKNEMAELQKLQECNSRHESKTANHQEKKMKICVYLAKYREKLEEKTECVANMKQEIMLLRQQHIQHLTTYIFPISEAKQKLVASVGKDSDSDEQRTVNALADAQRTSYVGGKWIYADNGSEQHYRVVWPTLPSNGDYSECSTWCPIPELDKKDLASSQDSDVGPQNQAYRLLAALSYTTQLVSLLAYFLDVHLPKKLCYGEFCGRQMTEAQFKRAVYKLNQNVLHLCFTQKVEAEALHPQRTIHNILVLLRTSQLGRDGSFTVNAELMQLLNESHQMEEPSDYRSSSEDEVDGAVGEWERVPTSLPEVASSRTAESYFTSQQGQSQGDANLQTTASVAGGLMTSAAASVASFWRAATGRKDS